MSASPSGQSNGQAPTPNGGPQFIRRPKAADPLRPRKKPPPKRPQEGAIRKPNGPAKNSPMPTGLYPVNGLAPTRTPGPYGLSLNGPADHNGWSGPPKGAFHDFPLITTKRALRDGLRYHIARFAAKKTVDPRDQIEFTRPVVLHRRDPKQERGGKEYAVADEPLDSKEREKQEILKAEKEKQRAIDLAQIAPTGNNPSALVSKKSQSFKNEKTTQVHRMDKTEEEKKASDLRYEEALPWHLEDADNKNTWVGNYEAALSSTNVLLIVDGSTFRMIPAEKWYKFTAKGQFKTFTSEEAEERMNKKVKESRWVMKSNEQKVAEREAQESRKAMHNLYTVKAESNTFKNSGKRETEDMDDLDFDGDDLFQDDDEQATVEPDKDEDTKEAQDRIKRDQLAANVFNQTNEADVDLEAEEERREKEKRKMLGKSVKKALKKRERNLIYDSDASDHNPYSEESEDDTSDEEKQKEIDRKKDEEAKNKAKQDPKLPSGASSKGTSTPSGRPKHTDALKKPNNLKRPGGDVSESSGNESTRKKQKKKHHSSTGASTPVPGSRQISPIPLQGSGQNSRKSSIIKLNVSPSKLSDIQSAPPNPSPVYPGATSDGEATGGEMSDGGKKTKLKLRLGHTPTTSRQGSPAPGRAGSVAAGGSRAGSPALQTPGSSSFSLASSGLGPIQPHEIIAALPESGITIGDLMKLFQARVGTNNKTERAEFIKLVKENSKYGPDKLLRRKEAS